MAEHMLFVWNPAAHSRGQMTDPADDCPAGPVQAVHLLPVQRKLSMLLMCHI